MFRELDHENHPSEVIWWDPAGSSHRGEAHQIPLKWRDPRGQKRAATPHLLTQMGA